MNETSLIELIQTHLPEQLTAEQISEIREKLAGCPQIQEALLEELSPGQGPATEHAPAVTNFDEVIARIESLATLAAAAASRRRKRRRRRLVLVLAGAFVLVVVAAVELVVYWPREDDHRDSPPVVVAATRPAASRSRPATRVATAPKVRPVDKGVATGKEPIEKTGVTSTTRSADSKAPAGFGMTWQQYVLPGAGEGPNWRRDVAKLFQRRQGKAPTWSADNKYYQLDGTYALASLPATGRMLRLGVHHSKKCDLEFWNGNDGVRILIEPQAGRIQAHSMTRRDARSKPTVTNSQDDLGAWQWYRLGAVDLRYQNAHILVCRGEIPLLRAAMPRPPTGGSLIASGVGLWLAEAKTCRPLALPVEKIDKTSITDTPAAKFTWQKKPEDKTKLSIGPGDAVALSSQKDDDAGRAGFMLDVPPITGMEVTMHVRDCTPPAGIFVHAKNVQDQIRIASYKNKRVVGSGKQQEMEQDILMGRVVDKEFWVRIRCGLDFLMVWVSPDGKRWWRRKYQPFPSPVDQLQIGLEILPGKGPRRIAVDDIRIRRFEAIRRLAAPQAPLLAKAAPALITKALNAETRQQALAILDEARPKNVDPAKWQTACDVHLLAGSLHSQVRLGAAREIFLAAACRGGDRDRQAVLAAARELMEIAQLERPELPQLLRDVFDALGRSCLEAGKPQMLKAIMDAGYLRPGSMGLPRVKSSPVVPRGLLRLYLLDLMARGEWESVRLEAMRAMFLARGHALRLAQWAAAGAHARLGGQGGADGPDVAPAWAHPLVVHADHATLNILGEFLALVREKHYESACTVITGQALPDALVALGGEQDILWTSHFRVREVIRTTPQLRQVLKERHSEIGMIRLERARKHNDLEALKALTAQFYGTEPGFAAMHVLADRDLSNGNFYAAAGRYQLLQGEQEYARRRDAAAKFRLASAMFGRLAGEPPTQPVVLPGKTFSPQEFEQMVRRLVTEHKAAGQAFKAAVDAAAPGPRGTGAKLTLLADVPGKNVALPRVPGRPTAFAIDGNCLVVNHFGKLFAIDWPSRRTLWFFEPQAKDRDHWQVKPLRIGNRLYVRPALKGCPVACFEIKTGKHLWSKSYDDRVLSGPIPIGSWLYVITTTSDMSNALYLHRLSPETGESSLRSELVWVRDERPAIGRSAVVGDGILFRAPGSLVNCNLRGAVRWARQLPFPPPEVLPEMHAGMGLEDMLVWQDKKVIFTARGCPYVMCVAGDSGKLSWSFVIHSPTRLVGLVAGSVILVESDRICALDPASGKIRWQRRCSTGDIGILPAEKDTLVLLALKKQSPERKSTPFEGRYIRWISAKDGRVVKELRIDGDPAIYGVWKVFSD
ncbi:MAG: PQQ-binding-like beta-propeller repeat protein, partial [Phycisphaerae bacterium]|nr:PQQ-binding-like beta-propeller repeat protein [Phycisphaerae bacterium]